MNRAFLCRLGDAENVRDEGKLRTSTGYFHVNFVNYAALVEKIGCFLLSESV